MVTNFNEKTFDLRGLSTDAKPVENIGNGSTFLCIDNGDIYIFNEETKTWIKM